MARRKNGEPVTEAELIEEAYVDLDVAQRRLRRRRWRIPWPWWLDRRVLIGLLVVLVIIIAEGVRRENQEFRATLTQIFGAVSISRGMAGGLPATPGQTLEDGDVVNTGPQAEATLTFPDGSVVTVGPSSVFMVRLVDYSRAGRYRDRAFVVTRGQVWATASSNFGRGSQAKIFTPSAVAAVRGTVFYAAHDPSTGRSIVSCADGTVAFRNFAGAAATVPGGAVSAFDPVSGLAAPQYMMPADYAGYMAHPNLRTQVPAPPFLRRFTMGVASAFDLVLQPLGIGKASWGVAGMNYARKTAAMEQLRALHQVFEVLEGGYPETLNPMTLEELGLPADKVPRILKFFAGEAIEGYWSTGSDFRLSARARDKNRTLYVLSPMGVELVPE